MTAAPPTFPPKVAKVLESLRVLKWSVKDNGDVRCTNGWCPVAAAANLVLRKQGRGPEYMASYTAPGKLVGMTEGESFEVAQAADLPDDPRRPHLLALLGIPEQNR